MAPAVLCVGWGLPAVSERRGERKRAAGEQLEVTRTNVVIVLSSSPGLPAWT